MLKKTTEGIPGVKTHKKTVSKTKKLYIKKFHAGIRCLKTRNPPKIRKLINKESDHSSSASEPTDIPKFIDHFS